LSATTTYTVSCSGPSGSANKSVTIYIASTSIATVQAGFAATPNLGGAVHYYCDCGTGASSSCVAGNNSNTGTSKSAPKQTIAAAISDLNSIGANGTIALCQGGAFNAGALTISRSGCAAGNICAELREYSPTTFSSTAKPRINFTTAGASLFTISGPSNGGVRILNLDWEGDAQSGGTYNDSNWGLYLYNAAHDITLGNNTINGFDVALYDSSTQPTSPGVSNNVTITGNDITNIRMWGYLGSGNNFNLTYNNFIGDGASTSLDHPIYLSSWLPTTNINVSSNNIQGQYLSSCLGSVIVAHGGYTNLSISSNTIAILASAATGGCWGISFGAPAAAEPTYFRNTNILGNTIINTGSVGINVNECPNCVVENNLIEMNWNYAYGMIGIQTGNQAYRSGLDDMNTANVISNNTIWTGSNAVNGITGVWIATEGTGYVVANNTVNYSSTSSGSGSVNCFQYDLSLSAYSFINNNNCYSAYSIYNWEHNHGATLPAWRTYSSGFDSASFTGDPLFTAAGTDFRPATGSTGSPLIGAGNMTYAPSVDISGVTRPNPPTIGAYE
jgi:hypothetical protein